MWPNCRPPTIRTASSPWPTRCWNRTLPTHWRRRYVCRLTSRRSDYAKVIELGEAAAAAQPDETEKSDVYFILGAAYNAKEMKPQAIEALKKVTAGDNVAAAQKSVAELSK